MATGTTPATMSMSSGEFRIADIERRDDVEKKHRRIADFLRDRQLNGLFLQKPSNFTWFTSGAVSPSLGLTDYPSALFITADSRVVVTNNVDSAEIFERQLAGLGFLLKERPWFEERKVLLDDLARGRTVGSDTGFEGTTLVGPDINPMRFPLEDLECQRLRQLGKILVHAVEATARHVEAGQTEAEIAAQIAHRLIKHEATPVRITAAADGRLRHYPNWTYGTAQLRRWCVLSAIAKQHGLHCAVTRTVCLGTASSDVAAAYEQAAMVAASGIYFSQIGMPVASVWERIRRIYEKAGVADEWQKREQAEVIGYEVREQPLVPHGKQVLAPFTPIHWHPSVGPAHLGDTVMVREESVELITPTEDWPQLQITVKGYPLSLPGLLERGNNPEGSAVI